MFSRSVDKGMEIFHLNINKVIEKVGFLKIRLSLLSTKLRKLGTKVVLLSLDHSSDFHMSYGKCFLSYKEKFLPSQMVSLSRNCSF